MSWASLDLLLMNNTAFRFFLLLPQTFKGGFVRMMAVMDTEFWTVLKQNAMETIDGRLGHRLTLVGGRVGTMNGRTHTPPMNPGSASAIVLLAATEGVLAFLVTHYKSKIILTLFFTPPRLSSAMGGLDWGSSKSARIVKRLL
jgi:hypothetical protein